MDFFGSPPPMLLTCIICHWEGGKNRAIFPPSIQNHFPFQQFHLLHQSIHPPHQWKHNLYHISVLSFIPKMSFSTLVGFCSSQPSSTGLQMKSRASTAESHLLMWSLLCLVILCLHRCNFEVCACACMCEG